MEYAARLLGGGFSGEIIPLQAKSMYLFYLFYL